MSRRFALVLGLAVLARAATAADAPELPKPPTTPLPKFENPLHDAEIGETVLYRVRDPGAADDTRTLYYEERVLARHVVKGKERALIETIKTDVKGTKDFGVEPTATRWMDAGEAFELPPHWKFVVEKDKQEIVYLGKPPTKAVRCVHRFIQAPVDQGNPDGPTKMIQIWFSHDVPARGHVKRFPAQNDGERLVLSWDKRLSAEDCARRAETYADPELEKKEPAKTPEPATGEPGMGEPGMGEPGMGEPGKTEPGMDDSAPGK